MKEIIVTELYFFQECETHFFKLNTYFTIRIEIMEAKNSNYVVSSVGTEQIFDKIDIHC